VSAKPTTKTDLPFARAYDFLMRSTELIPAEKLVLFQVLRYYPKPCTMKRCTIARACGLKPDYVRNLIRWLCAGPAELRRMKRPPRRPYLRQGCLTSGENGEKLIRWLAAVDFPYEKSATGVARERDYKDVSATIIAPKRDWKDVSATIVPPIKKK